MLVVMVAALVALAAPVAGAGTAKLEGFQNCGKVADEGGRSPVKAARVDCSNARELAAAFIASDELARGWRTFNPAGCEWFMFRKGHKDDVREWFGSGDAPDFKLIYFLKMRGCES
jgi:hypothetical protein